MLRLLRQEDFAILLVSELAGSPHQLMSLTEIGRAHGVSLLFLKKLARSLRTAGIIDSKEGARGGYTLARDPKRISILEVLEAIGEKNTWTKTKEQGDCPLIKSCLPQKIRKTLIDRVEGSLHSLSLYDLTHI